MRFPPFVLLCLVTVTAATDAIAQQTAPCATPQHRQFDFWVGEWEVTDSAGVTVLGSNRITRILNDCVLHEHWTGARGLSGQSFNVYHTPSGRWQQTWVDGNGGLLQLAGGIADRAMVLEGTARRADGVALLHRLTWTPQDDGRVRQHWQTSEDGGATWRVTFDGWYRRVRPPAP